MRVLVAGASGYVGSRLVPALLRDGHRVRASSRDADSLRRFDWFDLVEPVALDATDEHSVQTALDGVDVVYYLVHGLGGDDFAETDRVAAMVVGAVAARAGVRRIVYLGGLVPDGERLSEHLDSRAEVGEILSGSGAPTVWLRAAVIVGAGSSSFELIRYVAERLRVIPVPRWMQTRVQPIAVDDVLHYLLAAPELPAGGYDIGGDEAMPYADLLRRYLAIAGLRRRLLDVPGPVPPWLAAEFLGRLTPVPSALTADLVASLSNTMVVADDGIRHRVPDPPGGLTGVDEAIRRALAVTPQDVMPGTAAATDALHLADTDPDWAGGDVHRVSASRVLDAGPEAVWAAVSALPDGLPASWRFGTVLTRAAFGPRLRWQRAAHASADTVRLEAVDPAGRGVLFVRVTPADAAADRGGTLVDVSFTWRPHGLRGRAFWWAARPWQEVLLPDLLRHLAASSRLRARIPS